MNQIKRNPLKSMNKGFFTAIIATFAILAIFMASTNYIASIDLTEGELFAQQINETNRMWQNAYFEAINSIQCNEGVPSIDGTPIMEQINSTFGEGSECRMTPPNPSENPLSFDLNCSKTIELEEFKANQITVSKHADYTSNCQPVGDIP